MVWSGSHEQGAALKAKRGSSLSDERVRERVREFLSGLNLTTAQVMAIPERWRPQGRFRAGEGAPSPTTALRAGSVTS